MNGVWIAHFNAGAAHGSGIAVVRQGEILGGDFSHSWIGTCEEEGSRLYARIRVASSVSEEQQDPPGRERPFMLTLFGSRSEREATLTGHADENETPISIELHRAV